MTSAATTTSPCASEDLSGPADSSPVKLDRLAILFSWVQNDQPTHPLLPLLRSYRVEQTSALPAQADRDPPVGPGTAP